MDTIRLQEGRAVIDEACKGCGRCVDACPHGAIELAIEDHQSVPDAIAHISTLVQLD